jgi:hypothetical protein
MDNLYLTATIIIVMIINNKKTFAIDDHDHDHEQWLG